MLVEPPVSLMVGLVTESSYGSGGADADVACACYSHPLTWLGICEVTQRVPKIKSPFVCPVDHRQILKTYVRRKVCIAWISVAKPNKMIKR